METDNVKNVRTFIEQFETQKGELEATARARRVEIDKEMDALSEERAAIEEWLGVPAKKKPGRKKAAKPNGDAPTRTRTALGKKMPKGDGEQPSAA